MSTIEELLATPQVEEVWEVDNRYVINSSYSDDQGPIEIVGKDIGDMSSQISIQGESISQYVEFIMPRYYDNIDLSEKNIVIHYTAGDRGGENAPINVYKSQERIKFGWAIPASATANEGTLSIGIWARGYVGTEEYMWKSRIAYYKVERGPVLGEGLSEPDVQWYLDFVREMDAKVTEASLYSTRAKQSENVAVESRESAIASSQTASDSANTAVQKAAAASNSASVASAHSTAAKVSADNAKESETKAQGYAEEARNNAEGFEPISDMMTGESPTATNSTNAPFIYGKFKGYTEQFTTSGKNLLNYDEWKKTTCKNGSIVWENNGVTITALKDDAYTQYSHDEQNDFPSKINVIEGEEYTLSWEESSDAVGHIYVFGQNNQAIAFQENEKAKKVTFTIPSGITQISYRFGVLNANVTISYKNIQIEKGSVATPYEPYTGGIASPNPDYPQEIEGLDKVSLKTCGKNLFGATLEDYQNASISGAGKEVYFNLKPNTTYCCSTNLPMYTETSTNIWFNGGDSTKHGVSINNPKTTTTDENGKLRITLRTSELITIFNGTYWIMLEEGDTATPYQPYTETLAEIDLTEPLYEGDYIEYRADGTGVLHRKMAKVVINGKNGIVNYYITTNGTFAVNKGVLGIYNIISHGTKVICDYLLNKTLSSMVSGEKGICNLDDEFIYINLTGSASTVDEAKAWLAENPITVVYELAEPTETSLTAEQVAEFKKLYTFEPVTNVLCDGEVEMIYFRNNPNGRVAGMLQRQIDSIVSTLSSTEEVSDEYRNNLS